MTSTPPPDGSVEPYYRWTCDILGTYIDRRTDRWTGKQNDKLSDVYLDRHMDIYVDIHHTHLPKFMSHVDMCK